LREYEATFVFCESCGFLSAENPYWLKDAYSSAIVSSDTGLIARNITIAEKLAVFLYFITEERGQGSYVDVAGGYGTLTRIMRDYGFNFFWSDKYCQNLFAQGFDYSPTKGECKAVTAFEVMEHTEDPMNFIIESMKYSKADMIIFSTELYEGVPPSPNDWWYYSFESGQHIAFFQRRTLQLIAEKLGMNFCSDGWLHIISKQRINSQLFNLIVGKSSLLLLLWVKRNLPTLTMKDHDMLIQDYVLKNLREHKLPLNMN
jgi:hypothetical protein